MGAAAAGELAAARSRDAQGVYDLLAPVGAAHVAAGRLSLPTYEPPERLRVSKHLHEIHRTWGRTIGTAGSI